MPMIPPEQILTAGFYRVTDGLQAVIEGVRGAGVREKAAGAFQITAVAFQAGRISSGRRLSGFWCSDAEGGVGSGFAAGFHFANARANFVEHGAFVQTFPGGDEADGGDAVLVRFNGGFGHGFRVDESVFGRAGLVKGGLGAEAAVLGTGAGLGVDDGAEVNLVALERFADAVGPGKQIVDIGGLFELEEEERFFAVQLAAQPKRAGRAPQSGRDDSRQLVSQSWLTE